MKLVRPVVAAVGVLVVWLWLGMATAPALAQGFLDDLPPTARARLVDAQGLEQAIAAAQGRAARVIVEFAPPSMPAGFLDGSDRATALVAAAVRARQDMILERAGLVLSDGREVEGLGLRRMPLSPMLALDATPEVLQRLATDPSVVRVHVDRLSRPALRGALTQIGMPAAYSAGATGDGQVVAVLDTGARLSHEFLASRIVAGACFNTVAQGSTSRCPGGATRATTLASGDDCTSAAIDGCGHGTHVAGIVAGFYGAAAASNPAHGVARDARILSINVFAQFPAAECGGAGPCLLSFDSDQIAALDHVYSLRNTYRIAAVNMSLGGGMYSAACVNDPLRPAVQRLRSAGIAVIAAAGNDGSTNQVNAPACIPEVIAVASVTSTDARSSFSNWGNLVNLAAPGSAIRSAYVSGASNATYANLSGTSMAAPFVAGSFAALRTVAPSASIDTILSTLRSTGRGITVAGVTVPRIDVGRAAAQLRPTGVATTTAVSVVASSPVGQRVNVSATVTSTSGGVPRGTVSFRANGTQFASVQLDAAGRASASTYALPVGSHAITAVYEGGSGFRGSTSAARTLQVQLPSRPVNDDFASAIAMPGNGRYAGNNTGATRQTGEPAHIASTRTDRSVWWVYTPSRSGRVTLDTCGSNFDTTLAVYTGTALGALRQVVSNDDSCGLQSRVQFSVVANTRYHIAVAGWNNQSGAITLNLSLAANTAGAAVASSTVLSGPTNAAVGQDVTFTATVRATGTTPTGTVSFRRNGVQFATGTLSGGRAVGVGRFTAGTWSVTAHYLGSGGVAPSTSAAVSLRSLAGAARAALQAGFAGGGSVHALSEGCAQRGWGGSSYPVQIRLLSGGDGGAASQITLTWATGAEHLEVAGPLLPSGLALAAEARQIWTFYSQAPDRPRVLPLALRVTQPPGADDPAAAQEMVLRLRVQGFAGIRGCSATVSGTLRRQP
jgi:subtilisin family serine protease